MEKDKIFKALICIGIVLCSVLSVGLSNVHAAVPPLDSDKYILSSDTVITFGKGRSSYYPYPWVQYVVTIKGGSLAYLMDNGFSVKGSCIVNRYESASENGTFALKSSEDNSAGMMGAFFTSVVSSTGPIYRVYSDGKADDLLFRQPLVKEAEKLIPTIQGETKMIIPTVVGLLGLLILSIRLLPGLKTFFRG